DLQNQGVNTYVKEQDLDLDIDFVENDMERYENLDLFRSLRNDHRDASTFDMDAYKDELVKMSQRMDKEALEVQQKLSKFVHKNQYSEKGSGFYSPIDRKVHMDMKDNSHEKALGNGLKGSWQTKFHEEGHQIDHLLGGTEEFGNGSV